MKVDACAVDSGGHEGRTQRVYDFCALAAASSGLRHPRRRRGAADLDEGATGEERQERSALHRRPRPGQDGGARVAEPRARSMPRAVPIPTRSGSQDELPEDWFDQVTGEVRRIRYVRNRPVIEFTPKRRGQRVEALDALCYAWAVRQAPACHAIDCGPGQRAGRNQPSANRRRAVLQSQCGQAGSMNNHEYSSVGRGRLVGALAPSSIHTNKPNKQILRSATIGENASTNCRRCRSNWRSGSTAQEGWSVGSTPTESTQTILEIRSRAGEIVRHNARPSEPAEKTARCEELARLRSRSSHRACLARDLPPASVSDQRNGAALGLARTDVEAD